MSDSRLALKVERLYQQVAEKIADQIDQGTYGIGERLPAERDLAALFGVSRPTIREAIIALEIEGYVEVRMGSGVYVRPHETMHAQSMDKDVGPFALTEARALIEGEAAALAASLISDEELAELDQILEAMEIENRQEKKSKAESGDKTFHLAIAKATQNSAIVSVVKLLWEMRETSLLSREIYQKVRASGVRPIVNEHREIYNALKERNPQAARAAMRKHLMNVIDSILDATEIEALNAARLEVSKHRTRYTVTRQSGLS